MLISYSARHLSFQVAISFVKLLVKPYPSHGYSGLMQFPFLFKLLLINVAAFGLIGFLNNP